MSARSVVFLGPSLPVQAAREILPDAVYLPPAQQGDIYRAVRSLDPEVVGLVDGAFLAVPAVWHREILWALEQGVRVAGAASMGALRAAELADFGMVGVGKIFEAYSAGRYAPFDDPFEDDDEVAIVHAPAELGGMPIVDAMVDLRETLAAAEAAGLLDRTARDALAGMMKAHHFSDRSFALLAEAARVTLDTARVGAFAAWLADNAISQKARDAAALLQAIACGLPEASQPPVRMERALVWERFVAAEEARGQSEEDGLVLRELSLAPDAWKATERAALGRLAAADDADTEADLHAELDAFRRARDLTTRRALDAWLGANAMSEAALVRLLGCEAALDEAARRSDPLRLRQAMLDHLRLSGGFAPLLGRARAKAQALAEAGAPPSAPALDAALGWYFEQRLRQPVPRSLAAHAAAGGHADEAAFRAAVWDEYRFARQGSGGT